MGTVSPQGKGRRSLLEPPWWWWPSGDSQPQRRGTWALSTHVGVETVGHELELAVGRDEGNGAVVLEAGQPHTLVEFHVL